MSYFGTAARRSRARLRAKLKKIKTCSKSGISIWYKSQSLQYERSLNFKASVSSIRRACKKLVQFLIATANTDMCELAALESRDLQENRSRSSSRSRSARRDSKARTAGSNARTLHAREVPTSSGSRTQRTARRGFEKIYIRAF